VVAEADQTRWVATSAGFVEEAPESGFGDERVGEGEHEGEVVVGEFVDGSELVDEGVCGAVVGFVGPCRFSRLI